MVITTDDNIITTTDVFKTTTNTIITPTRRRRTNAKDQKDPEKVLLPEFAYFEI